MAKKTKAEAVILDGSVRPTHSRRRHRYRRRIDVDFVNADCAERLSIQVGACPTAVALENVEDSFCQGSFRAKEFDLKGIEPGISECAGNPQNLCVDHVKV